MERKRQLVRVEETALGRGVVADRMIRRGQTIGQIMGEVIDDPEYGSNYCIDLGDGYTLEPAAPLRFLNHSCEPNAQVECEEERNGHAPAAWLTALRTIRRGEEITIDYGWSADVAIPCHCGSDLCRGWVVSEEELPRVLRRQPARRRAKVTR